MQELLASPQLREWRATFDSHESVPSSGIEWYNVLHR